MRRLDRAPWTLMLFLLPAAAGSQGLSLSDAISQAQETNHRIAASAGDVEATQAGIREARGEFLPSLSAIASFSKFDGVVFFGRFLGPPGQPPSPGAGNATGPFDTTTLAFLQLEQVLYAGGGNGARLESRRVEHSIAEQELVQQQLALARDVTEAYYRVLVAEKSIGVADESVKRSTENLGSVTRRRAEREAIEAERLGADSQLAADQRTLQNAKNNVELSRLALGQLLGSDREVSRPLTDALEAPPLELATEGLTQKALANNPALEAADLRIALADTMAKGARSHYRPKLKLAATYSSIDNETLLDGDSVGAALTVGIPFFKDITTGSGALGQARARRSMAENAKQELESGLRLEVRRAVLEAQEAYSLIGVAEMALAYHREAYRVTRAAYDEQLATFDRVVAEHAALNSATFDVYGAHYQARIAEARLRELTAER